MADAAAQRVLSLAASLGGPLLGLDSSTPRASLCLALPGAGQVLERSLSSAASLPSEALVEGLAALFEEAGLSPAQLRAMVVGLGPGSFTGLRVGLATLKGLALGSGVPVYGVSSLAVMAASAGPGYVAPILDARRDEWYAALYEVVADASPRALLEDTVLPPDEVVAAIRAHVPPEAAVRLTGDTAEKAADLLDGATAACVPTTVRMVHGVLLAEAALRSGNPEPLGSLVPRYMRVSEAERQLQGR